MKGIDFADYTDDNTPYIIGDRIDQVVSALEDAALNLSKYFSDNEMKPNSEKFHV